MTLDFTPLIMSWRFLLGGIGITIALAAVAIVASSCVGTLVALGRLYAARPIAAVLAFYVDSMRALPVLVVLVWTYFAFPLVAGISLPPFQAAAVAITLHVSAYVAEIVRAGIKSVRAGQHRAGYALGMSKAQVIRVVVFPQAIVRMLPPFASIVSVAIKDTAIAAVIAVPEYMKRSETIAGQSFHPVEVYTVALLVYFIIIFPATRAVDTVYGRVAHLGRS